MHSHSHIRHRIEPPLIFPCGISSGNKTGFPQWFNAIDASMPAIFSARGRLLANLVDGRVIISLK
jgi:hypothetical protein